MRRIAVELVLALGFSLLGDKIIYSVGMFLVIIGTLEGLVLLFKYMEKGGH